MWFLYCGICLIHYRSHLRLSRFLLPPNLDLGVSCIVPCRGHSWALTECAREPHYVRGVVLRHTSNHDSHTGVSTVTALPLGVLSVYLREVPGDWHPF